MTLRTNSEIRERARLIRKATPDILEELFEMSNHICDLCGHPIQDLICASLDHSTPVIFFARSNMPIEEAVAQAHDPKNLQCAHASCNRIKHNKTREEWFASGLSERDAPRILTDGQLLELQFRLGAGGRIRGPIQGRKNAESGQIQALGKIQGRENVESGHLASIQSMGGCIGGRKHFENKTGLYGRSPEKMLEDSRKAGRIGGRKAVESGQWAALQCTGNHTRWHIRRGIVNPVCRLCVPNPVPRLRINLVRTDQQSQLVAA